MEALHLFTMMLLAIAGVHLIFRAVDAVSRWFGRAQSIARLDASAKITSQHGSWYVFFDPDTLYGKKPHAEGQPRVRPHPSVAEKRQPSREVRRRPRV